MEMALDEMGKDKSTEELVNDFAMLIFELKNAKPEDRSELARRYAVTITELEKVYSYFRVYVNEQLNL